MFFNEQKTTKISMEKFLDYSIKIAKCVDQINDLQENFEDCLQFCSERSFINFYFDELNVMGLSNHLYKFFFTYINTSMDL